MSGSLQLSGADAALPVCKRRRAAVDDLEDITRIAGGRFHGASMCLVDSIVPKANRVDAIAYAFSYKDRWSTQVAILLNTLPLFSKICAHPNDVPHCSSGMRGFRHTILDHYPMMSVSVPIRSIDYIDIKFPEKYSGKLSMKIADHRSLIRNAIFREEIA